MIRGVFHSLRSLRPENAGRGLLLKRSIATSAPSWQKKMPDRPGSLDEVDITETFLKGSGPGGQKINKTSSAVQLKHLPTGIVLKVQATRSRAQNRKIARQMLADKVEELVKGKESRRAVVGETKRKKKSSAKKKSARKYRALEEAKQSQALEDQISEVKSSNDLKELKP